MNERMDGWTDEWMNLDIWNIECHPNIRLSVDTLICASFLESEINAPGLNYGNYAIDVNI